MWLVQIFWGMFAPKVAKSDEIWQRYHKYKNGDVVFTRDSTQCSARISYRSSASPSVCPSWPGTDSCPGEIETPGFHRMISCEQISGRCALAETWRRVLGDEIFFAVPPNWEICGGRRGTHCILELNGNLIAKCMASDLLWKFLHNPFRTFWLILNSDRQTHR